ncbi:MAG: hypothetical protein IKC87_04405 [Clostridia bacterium]|nr:hypothetical protein [Clostridia bacterium]
MKKILSSALVVVLLFVSVAGLIPVSVSAAHSSASVGKQTLTASQIISIVKESYKNNFSSYEEMLESDLANGYLDYINSTGNAYTIYVNRYNGVMYYKNNRTGQILCSNPYNPGAYASDLTKKDLMNQITIRYSHDSGEAAANNGVLTSATDSADRAQITTTFIANGIRVNYTIGDTTTRYNVPMQITEEAYIEFVLDPMLDYYHSLFESHLVETYGLLESDYNFYAREKWGSTSVYDRDGRVDLGAVFRYAEVSETVYKKYLDPVKDKDIYNEFKGVKQALATLRSSFTLFKPDGLTPETAPEDKPLLGEGVAIYVCSADTNNKLKRLERWLTRYSAYTIDMLTEHEAECKYVHKLIEHPVFRCSLEYSFNSDGSLSVRLPVNSISFDEALYNLDSITPLQYFGSGDLTKDGYVFIPDGSGSVIEYSDFYDDKEKQNVSLILSVYGDDFAYANPSGKHKEIVTMPVYGITTTARYGTGSTADYTDHKGGFFAILEEGASLATMYVSFGGNTHQYSSVYASYSPYPSDEYKLDSSTGGSGSTYKIVSDSKYTGSYITRYVMLDDPTLAGAKTPASYVGMANYYRDYLKSLGDLTALENVGEDLPLYIEALGSMTVMEKFLTFPVTVSKPLTTFDDIVTMYKELADVTTKFKAKAKEYRTRSEAEVDNKTLREKYAKRADEYDKLVDSMKSISNINFKLTGFANGGMYFTYPTAVNWEGACGGSNGFVNLINQAKAISKNGASFGVYPEFDFSYMSNSAWLDGVDEGTDLSRMVDNRYASKQVYNSVLGFYESFYSMVISSDALDRLYTKFNNSYSSYNHKYISVSTLGSDLNSNFDKENPINRDESSANIAALLDRMANTDGYDVMISQGNSYVLGYADHILDISTDSSHFTYSSYTVPFIGMVLHGYVNYAGSPINYAGSPDYEILRAIENGASLYYILCYDNTEFMKEDEVLNDYYGIDYQNWYDDLVQQYNVLNAAIGKYQDYEIVDHKMILTERVIDEKEMAENRELVKDEFVKLVEAEILEAIRVAFDAMRDNGVPVGTGIKLSVDTDKLVAQASELMNISVEELKAVTDNETVDTFYEKLLAVVAKLTADYSTDGGYAVSVDVVSNYAEKTAYDIVTDSTMNDDEDSYDYTRYTADNDRVAMVTYKNQKTGHTVRFILNYNVYSVTVRLDANTVKTVEKYGFYKIEG